MKSLRPELCGEDRSDISAAWSRPSGVCAGVGGVSCFRSSGRVGAPGGWGSRSGSWDSTDRKMWACLRGRARVQASSLASWVDDTPSFLEMDRLSVFACLFVLNEKWGLGMNSRSL